jgi:hypothetical protein
MKHKNLMIEIHLVRNVKVKVIKYHGWKPVRSFCKHQYLEDIRDNRPPLGSSGQSSWLQIHRSRLLFPELPDILSSSGCGTGPTQPREYNWKK